MQRMTESVGAMSYRLKSWHDCEQMTSRILMCAIATILIGACWEPPGSPGVANAYGEEVEVFVEDGGSEEFLVAVAPGISVRLSHESIGDCTQEVLVARLTDGSEVERRNPGSVRGRNLENQRGSSGLVKVERGPEITLASNRRRRWLRRDRVKSRRLAACLSHETRRRVKFIRRRGAVRYGSLGSSRHEHTSRRRHVNRGHQALAPTRSPRPKCARPAGQPEQHQLPGSLAPRPAMRRPVQSHSQRHRPVIGHDVLAAIQVSHDGVGARIAGRRQVIESRRRRAGSEQPHCRDECRPAQGNPTHVTSMADT